MAARSGSAFAVIHCEMNGKLVDWLQVSGERQRDCKGLIEPTPTKNRDLPDHV
ncbi:hypothetical protein M413DRAFT_441231 [Hebeloma cylindrosporum]|uniref:Uncharacterized protein n=1 Tax=Hebeloma cylindrosporum TaxID=76867 RepID=A0A0C2Y8L2_HEBCY|nr:hypothetical protein M413DRAFT_441231 [Hebeloma cylindrosporum h7]